MDSGYVTQKEYLEHNRRMEDEHDRQNARIKTLEEFVKQIHELVLSVGKMAVTMEGMLKEQQEHSRLIGDLEEQIEEIHNKDGAAWRDLKKDIIKAAVGILVGFLFAKIGIL